MREHSGESLNCRADRDSFECVKALAAADRETLTRHIDELEREWDVKRALQTNASVLALTAIVLGAAVNKKYLGIPGVVWGFFLQHALQGWCPSLPVLRRIGLRTRNEIGEVRAEGSAGRLRCRLKR